MGRAPAFQQKTGSVNHPEAVVGGDVTGNDDERDAEVLTILADHCIAGEVSKQKHRADQQGGCRGFFERDHKR